MGNRARRRVGAVRVAVAALLIGLITSSASAASGDYLWQARYDPIYFVPFDSATSPDGSAVFALGHSSLGDPVMVTVAYDAATGDPLWDEQYIGAGSAAIAVSHDGSKVFVGGNIASTETDTDWLTIAYDADTGDELWSDIYDASDATENSYDSVDDLDVAPDNSRVYVYGVITAAEGTLRVAALDQATGDLAWDTTKLGPSPCCVGGRTVAANPDGTQVAIQAVKGDGPVELVTAVFDADTGDPGWSKSWNGPAHANAVGRGIAFAPGGARLYAIGNVWSDDDGYDFATLAYGAAGGHRIWSRIFPGRPGNTEEDVNGLAISPDGTRIVVTGTTQEGAGLPDSDFTTIAYRASGDRSWIRRFAGPAGADAARAVAVNKKGTRVFVTGYSFRLSDPNYPDFETIAYGLATGDPLWKRRFKPGGYPYDLSFALGRVFVAGDWTDGQGNGGAVVVAYAA